MTRPEWVEAGARAIGTHRKGHGWERDEDTWRNYTQIAEWALAAVEPLIRADERARVEAEEVRLSVKQIQRDLRAQIADDIEALPCLRRNGTLVLRRSDVLALMGGES